MSEPDCEKQEPCGYPQLDCVLGVYITKCEDRIEALTAEREFFEEEWVSAVDKLNKAVEALQYYAVEAMSWDADDSLIARTALAEIEEEMG